MMSMKCELFFSILDARGDSYTTVITNSQSKTKIEYNKNNNKNPTDHSIKSC